MEQAVRKQEPLVEGRINIHPDGSSALIGNRCTECGEVMFPRGLICKACGKESVEEIELSSRGTIWTYTVVHVSYGSVVCTPPYVTAFVRLDGGGYVHTPILGCDPEDVQVGMEVEMELVKTGQNEDADTVVYSFKPVGA